MPWQGTGVLQTDLTAISGLFYKYAFCLETTLRGRGQTSAQCLTSPLCNWPPFFPKQNFFWIKNCFSPDTATEGASTQCLLSVSCKEV